MQQISSRLTFFTKHWLPWIGLAVYLIIPPIVVAAEGIPGAGAFRYVFVAAMMLMGPAFFLMIRFVMRKVVDEVWDDGDGLLVRNAGREYRVPLRNCINVSFSMHASPPHVTVSLRDPAEFGDELVFAAPLEFSLNPFSTPAIVRTLITRIDADRQSTR